MGKPKAKSKKKSQKTKKKKQTTKKKKKKSKKDNSMPIKAAQKRKRKDMEESTTLAPIEYDSESSESSHLDNYNEQQAEDEELQAMITTNPSKKRKISSDIDSDDAFAAANNCNHLRATAPVQKALSDHEDEDVDVDEDMDLNEEKAEKKLSKKELRRIEKEKEEIEKNKLLKKRKNNFFGAATGKSMKRKKKKKTVTKSYVDANGMFVTEDVLVTDYEAQDDEKQYQAQMILSDDVDVAMQENKENATENTVVNKKVKKTKPMTPAKKKKNASITSFFRKK